MFDFGGFCQSPFREFEQSAAMRLRPIIETMFREITVGQRPAADASKIREARNQACRVTADSLLSRICTNRAKE